MRVFVYFNLHRKVWSVKALEGAMKGRVVAHRTHLMLADAMVRVSQAGRRRVLAEQRKNVHAGVVGQWCDQPFKTPESLSAVTYNPYKYSSFVCVAGELPVAAADRVYFNGRSVGAAGLTDW